MVVIPAVHTTVWLLIGLPLTIKLVSRHSLDGAVCEEFDTFTAQPSSNT
jgi:hypothetical protein